MSVQRASFYILLALVTIAFAWLLLPYYSAVLWAVILAVVFSPVQQRHGTSARRQKEHCRSAFRADVHLPGYHSNARDFRLAGTGGKLSLSTPEQSRV